MDHFLMLPTIGLPAETRICTARHDNDGMLLRIHNIHASGHTLLVTSCCDGGVCALCHLSRATCEVDSLNNKLQVHTCVRDRVVASGFQIDCVMSSSYTRTCNRFLCVQCVGWTRCAARCAGVGWGLGRGGCVISMAFTFLLNSLLM